tara:strand:+ start:452 stop:1204 length:753 start_codon:yes stop_codon:yes gene_type:complete
MNASSVLFAPEFQFKAPGITDFKEQAKRQQHGFTARALDVKLADVQETLAYSYGFANYATYRAAALQAQARVLDQGDYNPEDYVQYLMMSPDDLECYDIDAAMVVCRASKAVRFPTVQPNCQHVTPYDLSDFLGKNDYPVEIFREASVLSHDCIDESTVDTSEFIIEGVLCQCPRVNRYGVPEYGTEQGLSQKLIDGTDMKTVRYPEVDLVDTGDDTSGMTLFLVSVPKSQALVLDGLCATEGLSTDPYF